MLSQRFDPTPTLQTTIAPMGLYAVVLPTVIIISKLAKK